MADTLYSAPVVPGGQGAARVPLRRADKVLIGRVHLARPRPGWRIAQRALQMSREPRPWWWWRVR